MKFEIGKKVRQNEGFSAFVPSAFPPWKALELPGDILIQAAEAGRLIGKLDGVTHTLPDVEFFLRMFVAKDAVASSQIEGTKATLVDAIEMDAGIQSKKTDADDILYYIKALHQGQKRLKELPLSLRLVREIHAVLMTDARSTHFSDPGEFRRSQNWIGGTTPSTASFVPPPVHEMTRSLHDFEKFLYEERLLSLVHIGLCHAQFETIHPFLDGNGRTGRILITLLLCHRNLLERPVLFLSSFFKKHQKLYYAKLNAYHRGEVGHWLRFFLEGTIETAKESIQIAKDIRKLRDDDMAKIQALAKRESGSGIAVLSKLFGQPIVTTHTIREWTGFTRAGAQKLLDRFVRLKILEVKEEKYHRPYIYKNYVDLFIK